MAVNGNTRPLKFRVIGKVDKINALKLTTLSGVLCSRWDVGFVAAFPLLEETFCNFSKN